MNNVAPYIAPSTLNKLFSTALHAITYSIPSIPTLQHSFQHLNPFDLLIFKTLSWEKKSKEMKKQKPAQLDQS
jgi:hypothetical protein